MLVACDGNAGTDLALQASVAVNRDKECSFSWNNDVDGGVLSVAVGTHAICPGLAQLDFRPLPCADESSPIRGTTACITHRGCLDRPNNNTQDVCEEEPCPGTFCYTKPDAVQVEEDDDSSLACPVLLRATEEYSQRWQADRVWEQASDYLLLKSDIAAVVDDAVTELLEADVA